MLRVLLSFVVSVGLCQSIAIADEEADKKAQHLKVIAEKIYLSEKTERLYKMNVLQAKKLETYRQNPDIPKEKRLQATLKIAEKYAYIGDHWTAMKQPAEAKKFYTKSMTNFQLLVQEKPPYKRLDSALYKLAVIFLKLGDQAKATAHLTQLIQKHPKSKYIKLANDQLQKLK